MPLHIGWQEILVRLGLAFGAAFLIGLNRGRRGEAAGLRTTLLVCLAAAVSMIQVNLLLAVDGKSPSSFAVMDLMRLPLGILTGMGFIGGGAILKKGNLVLGVTTAASLWFTTVMGLCFGGGQIGLGLISLALALFVLAVLKSVENHPQFPHQGLLTVSVEPDGVSRERINEMIEEGDAKALSCSINYQPSDGLRKYEFMVGSREPREPADPPAFVERLAQLPSMRDLKWQPEAMNSGAPSS